MIQVSGVTKSYSGRYLFSDAAFAVAEKERIGLVGRNGCGKSTLSKIILGLEPADSGDIGMPKGYKLGYLDQHISFSQPTLLEECALALPEEYMYEYYRVEKLLFGLGFTQEDLEKDPRQFSGGYQLRINLTKCLVQEPDLLVLDEPTNYLDLPSLRWMKSFLKSYPGEVILITHDREFMDDVITHTVGIHREKVRKIPGTTDKYYEQIKQDEIIYEKTRSNQQKRLDHLQRFVDRFRAKASKATQAQSVMKRIEKMEVFDELHAEQLLGFHFTYEPTPAKTFIQVKNLSFGFDDNSPLFSGLSFDIRQSDRLAVIGKNGKGKTTLLNVLAHQLEPLNGNIQEHPTTRVGYYQQTNRKDLDPECTIEQEINKANDQMEYGHVRAICGAMMFSGDDAKKKIKVLSGGEQGRVLLGKILAHPHNVLFLDEPTNHLDMESIAMLTDELTDFKGPVLLVTHNENMLRRLATKIVYFRDDQAHFFNGTYEEFLEKVGWDEEGKKRGKKPKKGKPSKGKKINKQKIEKRVAELEAEIQALETQIEELNKKSAQADQQGPTLYEELAQAQKNVASKMEEWESLSSELK